MAVNNKLDKQNKDTCTCLSCIICIKFKDHLNFRVLFSPVLHIKAKIACENYSDTWIKASFMA